MSWRKAPLAKLGATTLAIRAGLAMPMPVLPDGGKSSVDEPAPAVVDRIAEGG